jgi:hypothetical protein
VIVLNNQLSNSAVNETRTALCMGRRYHQDQLWTPDYADSNYQACLLILIPFIRSTKISIEIGWFKKYLMFFLYLQFAHKKNSHFLTFSHCNILNSTISHIYIEPIDGFRLWVFIGEVTKKISRIRIGYLLWSMSTDMQAFWRWKSTWRFDWWS